MATEGQATTSAALGFSSLPLPRQVGVLVGVAASIALGIVVAMWSFQPTFRPLYSNMNSRDASEVVDVLQRNNISYRIDRQHGTIMVAGKDIHDARMKLAAQGLPRGEGHGLEMLENESGLGSSQFMETARYRHALEGELARTISNFANVKSARVHLAIPRRTVFMRDQRQPSASVFVDLYSGRSLQSSQIAAITNLVASSVPELASQKVTLVDQQGRLLTEGSGDEQMGVANRLFAYRSTVENTYAKRIQDILTPILGPGRVKAKVSADIDFTASEHTRESYDPELSVVRSEHSIRESRSTAQQKTSGIPGALSNQPPVDAAEKAEPSEEGKKPETSDNDGIKQITRNYELDKTISYTQQQPGRIRRITVAVLVDDKVKAGKGGKVTREPLTEDEIKRITILVKDAVGFNPQRGDSVNVINNAFAAPEPVAALPEAPMWQQAWFWDVVKQVAGGIFVLLLVLFVLRPLLKGLASRPVAPTLALDASGQPVAMVGSDGSGGISDTADRVQSLQSYQDRMQAVQQMAHNDPQRVAQVVKSWVDA